MGARRTEPESARRPVPGPPPVRAEAVTNGRRRLRIGSRAVIERVLMTGAAGRIGSCLRPGLRPGLRELRLSDVAPLHAVHEAETVVPADLGDAEAVARAVEGVDAIVHLGANPGEAGLDALLDPNVRGVFHVLDAARRAGVGAGRPGQLEPRDGLLRRRRPSAGRRAGPAGQPLRRDEGVRRGARPDVRRQVRPGGRVPADRDVRRAPVGGAPSSPPG